MKKSESKPGEVRLSVACMVGGRIAPAFSVLTPEEVSQLPASILEYRTTRRSETAPVEGEEGEAEGPRSLTRQVNTLYGGSTGRPIPPSAEDLLVEEMEREAEENEVLRAAVAEGQEAIAADIAKQKAQIRATAEADAAKAEMEIARSEMESANADWDGWRGTRGSNAGGVSESSQTPPAAAEKISPRPELKPRLKAKRKKRK